MLRASLGSLLVVAALDLLFGATAVADGRGAVLLGPPQPVISEGAFAGHVIYLNRCIGGCQINPGDDDATLNPPTSGIVSSAKTLSEFTGFMPGEWEAIVQCVQQVYSPFNATVTDTRPPDGTPFSMIMVGGSGAEIGIPGVGGVALVSGNCQPFERGVSYAFTDEIDIFGGEDGGSRVFGMCWTMAQETAHSFGLDHEYEFQADMQSACNDPMTYRSDCGGQKFFRDKVAACGEFEPGTGTPSGPRPCNCGASQDSHLRLLGVFGAGQSSIAAPTVAITTPAMSSTAPNSLPANIIASAGSARGVDKVELYLNGFLFTTVKGAPFGRTGQLNPSAYGLMPMTQLPDSIYDIKAKAYDDLGVVGESPVITVVKGANAAGCADATTCLAGQKCEMGRCFWDPPAGNVGDDCSFPQFCLSGICSNSVVQTNQPICTQHCIPGVADSCPMGFECDMTASICLTPASGGGCCSSSTSTPWAPFGFAGVVLGLFFVRRRR